MTLRHCTNDAKEADILDPFGLPFNGGLNLGGLTLRYMEIIIIIIMSLFKEETHS